jgi:hypothetical protein
MNGTTEVADRPLTLRERMEFAGKTLDKTISPKNPLEGMTAEGGRRFLDRFKHNVLDELDRRHSGESATPIDYSGEKCPENPTYPI